MSVASGRVAALARWPGAAMWPLPALAAWALCWAAFALLRGQGADAAVAALLASGLGTIAALYGATPWRRVFMAAGFPLSLVASGLAADAPAWLWLAPLAVLGFVYPFKAWRDAPVFPTPRGALLGLAKALPLPPEASILDAGCGLGAGLRELRGEYPDGADCTAWNGAGRCAWPAPGVAAMHRSCRGDLWTAGWGRHDLVYLFQRPESLARALAKAAAEMKPGSWLASLEFAAADVAADAVFACADGRSLHLYRIGPRAAPPARFNSRSKARKRY